MRPLGNAEQLHQRRRHALELLRQGLRPVDVARRLGVDRRSVRRWRSAWRKRGERGIQARPTPGRPLKLSASQRRQLTRALVKGARAAGFLTDLWTCPRVAQWIRRRLGVQYHVDHLGRLLRALGFTPRKPQRWAAERDEPQIRRWVAEPWPRIKKKPRASRHG